MDVASDPPCFFTHPGLMCRSSQFGFELSLFGTGRSIRLALQNQANHSKTSPPLKGRHVSH